MSTEQKNTSSMGSCPFFFNHACVTSEVFFRLKLQAKSFTQRLVQSWKTEAGKLGTRLFFRAKHFGWPSFCFKLNVVFIARFWGHRTTTVVEHLFAFGNFLSSSWSGLLSRKDEKIKNTLISFHFYPRRVPFSNKKLSESCFKFLCHFFSRSFNSAQSFSLPEIASKISVSTFVVSWKQKKTETSQFKYSGGVLTRVFLIQKFSIWALNFHTLSWRTMLLSYLKTCLTFLERGS